MEKAKELCEKASTGEDKDELAEGERRKKKFSKNIDYFIIFFFLKKNSQNNKKSNEILLWMENQTRFQKSV